MATSNFGKCQLLIPHKDWTPNSPQDQLRQNWSAIERWVNDIYPTCGGCTAFYAKYVQSGTITVPTSTGTASDGGKFLTVADFNLAAGCGTSTTDPFVVIATVEWPYDAGGTYRELNISAPGIAYLDQSGHVTSSVYQTRNAAGPWQTTTRLFLGKETWQVNLYQNSGNPLNVTVYVEVFGLCSACDTPPTC